MEKSLQNLREIIKQFTLTEGQNATNIPYLHLYQCSQGYYPARYAKSLHYACAKWHNALISCREDKRLRAGEILNLALDSPISAQSLETCVENPFLSVCIEFSIDDVSRKSFRGD